MASPVNLLISEVSFAKQACKTPSLTSLLQSEVSWNLIVIAGTGLLGVTTVQPLCEVELPCVKWGFADMTFLPPSSLQKHEAGEWEGCCVAPGEDFSWSVVGTILHVCGYHVYAYMQVWFHSFL